MYIFTHTCIYIYRERYIYTHTCIHTYPHMYTHGNVTVVCTIHTINIESELACASRIRVCSAFPQESMYLSCSIGMRLPLRSLWSKCVLSLSLSLTHSLSLSLSLIHSFVLSFIYLSIYLSKYMYLSIDQSIDQSMYLTIH